MDIPKEDWPHFDRVMLLFHSCVAYLFTIFYLASSKSDTDWPTGVADILQSTFFEYLLRSSVLAIVVGLGAVNYLLWKTGGFRRLFLPNTYLWSRIQLRYFTPYAIPLYVVVISEIVIKN